MTSHDDDTVKNYVTPRDAALLALDLNWARLHWPGTPPDDETLLLMMHKIRVELRSLPVEARCASATWLRERGFHLLGGAAPDPENLPK